MCQKFGRNSFVFSGDLLFQMTEQEIVKILLNVGQGNVASALFLDLLEHDQAQSPGTLGIKRPPGEKILEFGAQGFEAAEKQLFLVFKMSIEGGTPYIGAVD